MARRQAAGDHRRVLLAPQDVEHLSRGLCTDGPAARDQEEELEDALDPMKMTHPRMVQRGNCPIPGRN